MLKKPFLNLISFLELGVDINCRDSWEDRPNSYISGYFLHSLAFLKFKASLLDRITDKFTSKKPLLF